MCVTSRTLRIYNCASRVVPISIFLIIFITMSLEAWADSLSLPCDGMHNDSALSCSSLVSWKYLPSQSFILRRSPL
jgi:hypothetical protein